MKMICGSVLAIAIFLSGCAHHHGAKRRARYDESQVTATLVSIDLPVPGSGDRKDHWRTVVVGRHDNMEALRQDLERRHAVISADVLSIFNNSFFYLYGTPTAFELVRYRVEELGFKPHDAVTLLQIVNEALKRGLYPVPPEVAMQLRLDYADQPTDEYLYVNTNDIWSLTGNAGCLFELANHDGRLALDTFWTDPGKTTFTRWEVFVFLRRRK